MFVWFKFSPVILLLLSFSVNGADVDLQTLSTVTIKGQDEAGSSGWYQLKDELIKTEVINQQTIERVNASNVLEAVDNRPGVSVQTECSVCNARNITLNNMPGRFTTLLIDGVPIYSSLASTYGLDGINVEGVDRVDIARGAGASLTSPEALAGTVNIITKRPSVNETILKQQFGSYGDLRSDIYLGRALKGGAYSLAVDHRQQDAVDGVGYGISQSSGFKRDNFGVAYFIDQLAGFRVQGRFDVLQEDRGGGPLTGDYAMVKSSTGGNPFNFSAGPHGSPISNGWVNADAAQNGPYTYYQSGMSGLAQIIHTERQQGLMKAQKRVGSGELKLAAALAHNYQNSFYGGDALYLAHQDQAYLSAAYQMPIADSLLTLGTDYREESLSSDGFSYVLSQPNNGVDDYRYRSNGVFSQLYRTFWGERLEVNASLRLDAHNVFGDIVSPRLNFLYHHDNQYASRISAGRGFRAPTSFFELEHGMLGDKRIVRNITAPETSDNLSYALSFESPLFNWTASASYNRIYHMAKFSSGLSDGAGGTYTLFDSSPDPVTILGIDWVGSYRVSSALTGSLGLEHYRYDFVPGSLNFARPSERVYVMLDYDHAQWDLMARLTWTGEQDLAKFYNYAETQRYNLDGSVKSNTSPAYSVVDVRAAYQWQKNLSTFMGVNNLFDFQQARVDSYLWLDKAGNLDVTHIWGPNLGRQVYVGVKWVL